MEPMECSKQQPLVHVYRSEYLGKGYIIDVPKEDLEKFAQEGPVYILVAREGQKIRLKKMMIETTHPVYIEGWWDLAKIFVGHPLSVAADLFKQHSHLIFLDPERVHESFKDNYRKLILIAEKVSAGQWK